MLLEFTKAHGAGNDFIMIEDLGAELELAPEAVEYLCDRHFGIGADGLILVRPASSPDADCFMLYYNSDGTTAEMCGNGIRCFAKFVVDRGLVPDAGDELAVETLAGIKNVVCTRGEDGLVESVRVDMGAPILDPASVPTTLSGVDGAAAFDVELTSPVGTFVVSAVSMGNPHCIIFVDDPWATDVEHIGPVLEHAPEFPNRTNVEFASVQDGRIVLRVWERGCGETLACGTGACATAVAAAATGRSGRTVEVELPGGDLLIEWGSDDRVYMTGPAREVWRGTVEIEESA